MSKQETKHIIQLKLIGKTKNVNFLLKYFRGLFTAYNITVDGFQHEKIKKPTQLIDELMGGSVYNDKPAETKEQVIADAKIQIENMKRRLRELNVDDDFLAIYSQPRPSMRQLYESLEAAQFEAERLTPQSKLTDDESGETD